MRSIIRVAAVVAAAALPLVGLSAGTAVAKPTPKATPQIVITCSPNPVVETATSNVAVICQVEANPSLAGKSVTISSTQFAARCPRAATFNVFPSLAHSGSITIPFDNDGNATILAFGEDCAPGPVLFTADVDAPPFATAITKLVVEPPQVTAPGVHAFPNPEVEVGDVTVAATTVSNTASEVDAIFYVETNPVYAEQSVNLSSDQLTARCGNGSQYNSGVTGGKIGGPGYTPGPVVVPPTTGVVALEPGGIDNDGNAVFTFLGASCAAGKSTVIAEVLAGGPTYSTQFNILPPAVTI